MSPLLKLTSYFTQGSGEQLGGPPPPHRWVLVPPFSELREAFLMICFCKKSIRDSFFGFFGFYGRNPRKIFRYHLVLSDVDVFFSIFMLSIDAVADVRWKRLIAQNEGFLGGFHFRY